MKQVAKNLEGNIREMENKDMKHFGFPPSWLSFLDNRINNKTGDEVKQFMSEKTNVSVSNNFCRAITNQLNSLNSLMVDFF